MLKAKADNVTIYGRYVDLKNATQETLKVVQRFCPELIEVVKKKASKSAKSEEV